MVIPHELIKTIPYFSGLDLTELESLKDFLFEKRVQRGEIILFEGEPAEALYFIASGAVKIYKTSLDGKEQILNIVRPGDSFNDVALFDNGANPATAQAMTDVLLYGINHHQMEEILKRHPSMAMNIIKMLARRVRQLLSLVEDLSFRNVRGRVAKILLENIADPSELRPRLTQQEIAGMAGTAREVVGRSLKSLEDDGLIRLENRRVVIRNKEALRRLAAESHET
jgi:CRP/FNR family transcriptional regulator, cyclic AMP receptor protein